jgi:trigger factor
LEVTCKNTGPCEARISFSIPRDDFDKAFSLALKESGRNVRMKGFRPGKVPRSYLEKSFGPDARRQVVEHFSQRAFQQAIEEHDLKPVGRQSIDLDEVDFDAPEGLKHGFDVSLRPTIDLSDYKGLDIQSELAPVLDEELDQALDDLHRQHATPEPVGDEGLPSDGVAVLNLRWERDGETIFERDGLRMSPEVPPPGIDAEAFKEALSGACVGDERELPFTIPEGFPEIDEEHRGKEANCHFEVIEALKMIPASDEDIAKLLECEDIAAARDVARKQMAEAREQQEMQRQENVLLQQVLAAHEFELPGSMIEDQVSGRVEQLTAQLTDQGLEGDEFDAELSKQTEAIRTEVQQGTRALFLVSELAEREGLEVTQEDISTELSQIAQRNQASVEEVLNYYRENRLLDQVAIELIERKVRKFLRENANITDPS